MKKFLILFAILLGGALAYLGYLGTFQKMKVSQDSFGPYHLIYKTHKGPYEEVVKVYEEMRRYQEEMKIDSEIMFGIYYDDPDKVEKSKLRSEIGFVLSKKVYKKLQAENQDENIKFKSIPNRKYVFTTFPYKNMVSIFIGVSKAYPALKEYLKSKNYPEYEYKETGYENSYALELYHKDKIFFMITSP